MLSTRQQEMADGILFAIPSALGLLLLTVGPIVASAGISLTEWRILSPPSFIGLRNYYDIVNDELFWQSLKVTSTYVISSVPLGIAWAFGIALLMNQDVKFIALWRTIYYMPAVISGVVMSLLWIWVFNPQQGIVNAFLAIIGIEGPGWFYHPSWALPALILMSLWTSGGSMVIYLAGLQGVPTELYDAAAIDGANAWHRFWHVTLPMVSPVILFQAIMGVIGTFQVFTPAYIATQGGPANATLFYNFYLYRRAFTDFNMGYASGLAWILFVIILFLTFLVLWQSSKRVYYGGDERR